MKLTNYFFTFPASSINGGSYVVVRAPNRKAALDVMRIHFAFVIFKQYSNRKEAKVDEYLLTEIDLTGREVI